MFERGRAKPMVRPGLAALAGIQERGQVLGADLPQIPRQDSTRNTYMEEHDSAQRRIGSPADGQAAAQPLCLVDPWNLLGQRSEMDFISVCQSRLSFSSFMSSRRHTWLLPLIRTSLLTWLKILLTANDQTTPQTFKYD
jgi:hypothetical protein